MYVGVCRPSLKFCVYIVKHKAIDKIVVGSNIVPISCLNMISLDYFKPHETAVIFEAFTKHNIHTYITDI